MAITKYKGTTIEFGDGVSYVVPALTLRQVQLLQDRLSKYTGAITAESVELVIDTVQAALTRNYPDITRDAVADVIDLNNMRRVMDAVMGASGLVEAGPPGETAAAG